MNIEITMFFQNELTSTSGLFLHVHTQMHADLQANLGTREHIGKDGERKKERNLLVFS